MEHDSSDLDQRMSTKFVNDTESIELFFLEMLTNTNERGEFKTAPAVEILRDQFGFGQADRAMDRQAYNQPYNALWRLSQIGKLDKLSFGYRFPHDTFERLRVATPAPTEPVAEAAASVSADPIEEAQTLARRIEALDRRVVELNANRRELSAKQTEHANLRGRLETLEREIIALTDATERPEALEAERIAAQIKAHLASW